MRPAGVASDCLYGQQGALLPRPLPVGDEPLSPRPHLRDHLLVADLLPERDLLVHLLNRRELPASPRIHEGRFALIEPKFPSRRCVVVEVRALGPRSERGVFDDAVVGHEAAVRLPLLVEATLPALAHTQAVG